MVVSMVNRSWGRARSRSELFSGVGSANFVSWVGVLSSVMGGLLMGFETRGRRWHGRPGFRVAPGHEGQGRAQ
ncbi:hypothetical protein GCM10012319_40510 [Comamonas sp. KCTC 72670]|nr:hypothetical protein GCM10012319_40510 [Comamonas sp. KCTC 72670]